MIKGFISDAHSWEFIWWRRRKSPFVAFSSGKLRLALFVKGQKKSELSNEFDPHSIGRSNLLGGTERYP
jgi:hypothetical protein